MSLLQNHSLLIGNLHPMLRRVLSKATSLSYVNLPSPQNIAILNTLAKELHADIAGVGVLVDSLDWLYVLANNSADSNFGRINWINVNEVATGSPTLTSKKGWNGTATFGHGVHSGPNWLAGDCMMFFYSTVGGTVSAAENIQAQLGANSQAAMMRHRTNPRIDYIMNATVAGVNAYPNAAALDNTYYGVDNDNFNSVGKQWRNGVLIQTIAAGTGSQPDSSSLSMSISSPRITGIVGGGRSINRHNGGNNSHPALNTILQKYMAAVQALP